MAKAKVKRKKHRAERRSKQRHSRPTSTAIVRATPAPVIVQGKRPRELTGEEIELLKRTVAKGTNNDEFALFLWVCRKHKLDPLTRQIHCVKRYVSKHHKELKATDTGGQIEVWVPGEQMTIQMGIDGYRSLAGRDHADYGGCDEPEFDFSSGMKTPGNRPKKIPDKATIRLWKKGLEHPVIGVAYWEEYGPADLTAPEAFMWAKMPKHMLAKCAEALAIRKGYPELSDIYTNEEMFQADQDFTRDGRQITDAHGFAPSGQPVTHEARAKTKVLAEADRQLAEHAATVERQKTEKALRDERPGAVRDMLESNENARAIDIRPEPAHELSHGPTDQPVVEIDHSENEAHPIVRGDIGPILESLQKHCSMTWGQDSWWHCLPKDVETIRRMCEHFRYRLVEVVPKMAAPSATGVPKEKAPSAEHAKRSTGRADAKVSGTEPSVGPSVVSGTIERVTSGMTSRQSPTRQVKLDKIWYTSYVNPIFEFLDRGLGKKAELYIDARKNIVGAKRIGRQEFDSDGRTPVIQRDREAGGKSLFQ